MAGCSNLLDYHHLRRQNIYPRYLQGNAGSLDIPGECLAAPCSASLVGNLTTTKLSTLVKDDDFVDAPTYLFGGWFASIVEAAYIHKKSVCSNKQQCFHKCHPQ